ncbi:DNA polymerase III, delta subunit [Finegoldia magna SY403409CC001050417]|uniref:DNA polymerase III subunit delta n=1 Tax=Finegoldia magna TaxID=1260 RepID=A0A7D4G0Z0_FINMA|nr:DNA polymerase III subunit delta [Finegoldia magna]EGS32381.1 DNA polymerase III, delta subunit [Finegoldia magna SY403409CC001050417]QKH80010.1 DNA polymerase III subunit delta [Finegoldia magna]
MDFSLAKQKLDNNLLSNLVLIHGEEKFYIEKYLSLIKEHYNAQSFDEYHLSDFEKIYSSSETIPMFSDKRLILIDDVDLSKTGISKNKDNIDKLMLYIKNIPEYTLIIITSYGNVFKSKLLKEIAHYGADIEFNKLNRNQFKAYIINYLKGKKLNNNIVNIFIEYSLYLIKNSEKTLIDVNNELDKFKNLEKEEITEQDLNSLINQYDKNIFDLTDSIAQKNLSETIYYLDLLINDTSDSFKTLHMIIRLFRNLLYLKELLRLKVSPNEITKKLKISPYELNKIQNFVKNWRYDQLRFAIHKMYEVEITLKSNTLNSKYYIENSICDILAKK